MSKMLYKKGTQYRLREGWVNHQVFEEDQIGKAISDGWVLNPLDLFNTEVKEEKGEERLSLEAKAKELGVSFNARTTDETIKARIAEAENQG